MNSWQRQQAIRHVLLILIVGCAAGTIGIIWRIPEVRDRISNAIFAQTGSGTSVPQSPAAEASERAEGKKIRKPVPRPLKAPDPVEDITQPVAVEGQPPEQPAPDPADSSQVSIKSDSAAAYSSNSSRSPIVHVLKKGDKVQTTLELIDSEGRWSLIRTPDSKRPAFVRSENLERPVAETKPAKP